MDGTLDWYLLGVVLGLGVVGRRRRRGRPPHGLRDSLSAVAVARPWPIVVLALPWWALLARSLAPAWSPGSPSAASRSTPFPAALLAGVVLAALPVLGYVAAVAVPVAGAAPRAAGRLAAMRA